MMVESNLFYTDVIFLLLKELQEQKTKVNENRLQCVQIDLIMVFLIHFSLMIIIWIVNKIDCLEEFRMQSSDICNVYWFCSDCGEDAVN